MIALGSRASPLRLSAKTNSSTGAAKLSATKLVGCQFYVRHRGNGLFAPAKRYAIRAARADYVFDGKWHFHHTDAKVGALLHSHMLRRLPARLATAIAKHNP